MWIDRNTSTSPTPLTRTLRACLVGHIALAHNSSVGSDTRVWTSECKNRQPVLNWCSREDAWVQARYSPNAWDGIQSPLPPIYTSFSFSCSPLLSTSSINSCCFLPFFKVYCSASNRFWFFFPSFVSKRPPSPSCASIFLLSIVFVSLFWEF